MPTTNKCNLCAVCKCHSLTEPLPCCIIKLFPMCSPTTVNDDQEQYSKLVYGADKVVQPADEYELTPVLAALHGLEPIYPEMTDCAIFVVRALYPMKPIPRLAHIPITMVVYRDVSGDLTLINALRVNSEVEDDILALGPIRHIVKLGQFHGSSDAYYLRASKFGNPRYWAAPGATIAAGLEVTDTLTESTLPIDGAKFYTLPGLPFVESVITIPVENRSPLLVACDALMHIYSTVECSWISRALMNLFGFICVERAPQPAPIWLKHSVSICGKDRIMEWFITIDKLEWDSVVCAHGPPAVDCEHITVMAAVTKKLAVY